MEAISFLFFIVLPFVATSDFNEFNVIYLEHGDTYPYRPESRIGFLVTDLKIYCYRGCEKSLVHVFQTTQLQIDIENDDFTQYEGSTPEIVQEHYNSQKSIFSFNLLSTKKTRLKLNPFNQTCIGIEANQPYRINVQIIFLDLWRVIQITVGLLTFWYASSVSQKALFYYLSGVLLGIFASFLVLIYLVSKLFPRKTMMYGMLVGGWTVAIYFGQMLWENFQMIIVTYKTYVFWYVLLTGFTSFIICYRLGPPKNKRSRDIIKWSLQLASLFVIFYSSDYQEATSAVIILAVAAYYFPRSWLYRIRSVYTRRFPPKPRLLSSEEFYEQGVKETTKALDELRSFCNSPECKQWRMITKLNDPIRFASFMEGSSHIMDNEILEYEVTKNELSDSDLSEDDDDEEEQQDQDDSDNDNDEEISEDEEAGGQASSRVIEDLSYRKTIYSPKLNGSIGGRSSGYRRVVTYSTPSPASTSRSRRSIGINRNVAREYSDDE